MKRIIYILLAVFILATFVQAALAKGPYGHVWRGKTTAPTTTDDRSSGYRVGDVWVDETSDTFYVCIDDTISAAIWSTGGGMSTGTISSNSVLTSSDLDTVYVVSADATIQIPDADGTHDNKSIKVLKQGASGVTLFMNAGSFQESGTTIYNNVEVDAWLECYYSGNSVFVHGYGAWTRTN